jgi:hypothetical protein
LCNDGTWSELKIAGFLIEDGGSCYITWQEVWGKLDAFKRASNGTGNSFCEDGFAYTGHIFDQHMSMADNGDEAKSHCFAFTDNYFLYIGDDSLDRGGQVLYRLHAFLPNSFEA